MRYRSPHPRVRISRKAVLKRSRCRIRNSRQRMPWPGDRFEVVPDHFPGRIVLEQEPFLTMLGVMGGRGVNEAKLMIRVDRLHDPAEVERPETESMNLDGDKLPYSNRNVAIRHSHPA